MNENMLKLLLMVENMTEKELEYLSVWIEYNLQKKEALSNQNHPE